MLVPAALLLLCPASLLPALIPGFTPVFTPGAPASSLATSWTVEGEWLPSGADSWDQFVEAAKARHGDFGAKAALFLQEHRPAGDEEIDGQLLLDNLELALVARERFPWAMDVPEELFFNDVLPYAVLDETRESWRPAMLERAAPLVEGCKTAEEAIQALNKGLFNLVDVHYNTGRKRPNACPSESMAQKKATCTGLTILLVDACRSVGIPARAAGVYRWHDDRGNHTWAEVWDGSRWRFTGADEYDAKGLDRGWFTDDASKATAGDRQHAVWASSWKRVDAYFPLVWSRGSKRVAAVEVTQRYLKDDGSSDVDKLGADGEELSEEAALKVAQREWEKRKATLASELKAEDEAKAFRVGDKVLRIKEKRFGDAPEGQRSLWISMHGGGGAPARVNDQQWNNQIRLYEPAEGFYVAPRAPTDTWNLWHQGHIDPLFDRMIASYVTRHGVDPNRVYLMGYSAGGDGVYQLAPRMADRFAAASMMAGHPNETKPDGLRNLPFMLFMGGADKAYDRNKIAAQWRVKLAEMFVADPGGYDHRVIIYPGLPHWMKGKDRECLPWMAERTRKAWPKKIVWLQDDVTHGRFYWLGVAAPEDAKQRTRVVAEVKGQTITIEAEGLDRVALRLVDGLVDLDQPITVMFGGKKAFEGRVPRTREAIEASLMERADPGLVATARLVVARP